MPRNNNSEFSLQFLLKRFNQMLERKKEQYFEVFELEALTEYFIKKNKFTNAQKAIELGLKQHGDSYTVNLLNLKFEIAKENIVGASKISNKLQKKYPNKGEIFVFKAIIKIFEKKFDDAKNLIRRARQISDSDEIDYLYEAVGFIFLKMHQYVDGALFLKKFQEEFEDSDLLLLEIARAYQLAQKHKLSLKYYNLYLDKYPFDSQAWYELGVIQKEYDVDSSLEALHYCLSIEPEFYNAKQAIGDICFKGGEYQEAIIEYFEYEKHEQDEEIYFKLGKCFLLIKKYNLAEFFFKMANKNSFSNDDLMYHMALNYFYKKNNLEAEKYILELLKSNKTKAEYWFLTAKIQEAKNDAENAEKFYKEALKIENENADYWIALADFFFKQNNVKKALDILSSAIIHHITNYKIMYRLAAFAHKLNMKEQAEHFLQLAMMENSEKTEFELLQFYPEGKNMIVK